MKFDEIIKNAYEQEAIKLNQMPNKRNEALEYILKYTDNKKINFIVSFRNKLGKFLSPIQLMDGFGILLFILVLFILPSVITQNQQAADSSLLINSVKELETGGYITPSSNNSINIENNQSKLENKIPDIKRKEVEITDRAKILEVTPFKIEFPTTDLEDLKETKYSLNIVDYSSEDFEVQDMPTQHRITIVYKGKDYRSLMIEQVEDNINPPREIKEWEKIEIKNVDAYISKPQPNSGSNVIQISFWKDQKYYSLMGRDIRREKLVEIAQSLK